MILHKRNVALRGKRRDGMLVNHLLTAFRVDDDRKVVKSFNNAANLKAIGQIDRYRDAVLAQLIEKRVLYVYRFVHWQLPPSTKDWLLLYSEFN